jgi:hypothetical protein
VDEAMQRLASGTRRHQVLRSGDGRQLSGDLEESFRLFQGAVIDEYDRMSQGIRPRRHRRDRSIEEQQDADAQDRDQGR